MAYTKQTWADGDPSYPVSAARMNHIEDGIDAVDDRSALTTSPQFGSFYGNATSSEYAASPTMWQNVWYAAQGGPLSGLLPQAQLTRLKAFNKFLDDSIQADASQVFSVNTGTPWTAVTPMLANEFDAVAQMGNKHTGYGARVLGAIAAVETQSSGSEIDFAHGWDYAAKSARDAGSLIRQHVAYHSENQTQGIGGKVGAAWSMFVPLSIHTRDALSLGDYSGVEGHMNAASIIGDTAVTLETGHGAGGFRGTSAFVAGQTVQVDVGSNAEVRVIAPAGVTGDTLTFTAALSKAHAQYCRVAVLGSNGFGMFYMSNGQMKTDSVLVAQSISVIQTVITAVNGAGFAQFINQTGGSVGTPSAGTGRQYINTNKVFAFKNEDGIEAPIRTGHRKVTATNLTLTALDGGVCAVTDTSSARTITLPAANAVPAGWEVVVKDESGAAGTNNITVTRAGADDIEGVATKAITSNYGSLRVYSNGSNRWFVI